METTVINFPFCSSGGMGRGMFCFLFPFWEAPKMIFDGEAKASNYGCPRNLLSPLPVLWYIGRIIEDKLGTNIR